MQRTVLAACVILLGTTAAARADEPAEDSAKARQLYGEGKAEYDLGHTAQALAKFEAAYRAKPVPGLLFNIAQCHRLLGDLKSAAMTYRAFLRNESAGTAQAQKAAELLKQVEEAMERQSSAQQAPPLGLTQPEEKKPVVAIATTPSPPPAVVPLAVTQPPVKPTRVVESEPRPRLWTYVAGGGAVLAAAGGTMFALKAKSAASDLQSTPHDRTEIDRIEPQVRSDSSKASLLLVAAGVLAGATAALWVFHF